MMPLPTHVPDDVARVPRACARFLFVVRERFRRQTLDAPRFAFWATVRFSCTKDQLYVTLKGCKTLT